MEVTYETITMMMMMMMITLTHRVKINTRVNIINMAKVKKMNWYYSVPTLSWIT